MVVLIFHIRTIRSLKSLFIFIRQLRTFLKPLDGSLPLSFLDLGCRKIKSAVVLICTLLVQNTANELCGWCYVVGYAIRASKRLASAHRLCIAANGKS